MRYATLCILIIANATTPLCADWPQFRGPTGYGNSAEKGLPVTWGPDENIAWKTELPGAGGSCPIIVGNRIYVACYSGYAVPGESGSVEQLRRNLVCLSDAGKILWSKEAKTQLPEQENIRDDHGYASNTPVGDGKNVYAFFGKSGVFAYDGRGRQLWHADVGDGLNGWGSAASPILAGNLVIVNASVESQSLVALNKKTGKEVWRARDINESWNTPILVPVKGGKAELVVAIMGKILGFDPASGKQLWSCDTDIGWYMVPCLVAEEGVVYCVGGREGGALAVRAGGRGDVTGTHRLWTGKRGSNVTSPVYHKGHMYWMHENQGIAYCAEGASGQIVYEERIGNVGQVYASPLLAEGRIYYLARDGRTLVVAADPEFKQLAFNEIGEEGLFNAGFVAADGKLYLRSNRFLYCLAEE